MCIVFGNEGFDIRSVICVWYLVTMTKSGDNKLHVGNVTESMLRKNGGPFHIGRSVDTEKVSAVASPDLIDFKDLQKLCADMLTGIAQTRENQNKTEQSIDRLVERQGKTERSIDRLIESQNKTEQSIDRLVKSQEKTYQSILATSTNIDKTSVKIDKLFAQSEVTERHLDNLETSVNRLVQSREKTESVVCTMAENVDKRCARANRTDQMFEELAINVDKNVSGFTDSVKQFTKESPEGKKIRGELMYGIPQEVEEEYRFDEWETEDFEETVPRKLVCGYSLVGNSNFVSFESVTEKMVSIETPQKAKQDLTVLVSCLSTSLPQTVDVKISNPENSKVGYSQDAKDRTQQKDLVHTVNQCGFSESSQLALPGELKSGLRGNSVCGRTLWKWSR